MSNCCSLPPKNIFFVLIKCLVLRQVELFFSNSPRAKLFDRNYVQSFQTFLCVICGYIFPPVVVWATFRLQLEFRTIHHRCWRPRLTLFGKVWRSIDFYNAVQSLEERKNLVARQNISFQPKYYMYWIESNNSIEWPAARHDGTSSSERAKCFGLLLPSHYITRKQKKFLEWNWIAVNNCKQEPAKVIIRSSSWFHPDWRGGFTFLQIVVELNRKCLPKLAGLDYHRPERLCRRRFALSVRSQCSTTNWRWISFPFYLFIKLNKKNQLGFLLDWQEIQPLFITCWYMVVIDGHVFLCLTSMVVALLKQVTVLFLNRHFVENVCVYGVVSHAKNVLFLSFSHIFPRNLPNLKWHWEWLIGRSRAGT